jgi:PKHD-type hydroxylase
MNLENYYYYFQSALTPRFCDEVIEYGKSQKLIKAITGEGDEADRKFENLNKKELKNLKKTRRSNVIFLTDNWIYKEIHPYIHQANEQAGWNFQWDYSEPCQFTQYGKEQFYDWHADSFAKPFKTDNPNKNGKIRKLSVTISLSDESDYEGGDFEFDFRNKGKGFNKPQTVEQIRKRGSIIVFPSFVWHRVKPVTSGTRHSLVLWNIGWPFK